jgi:hypothetical protein
MTHSASLCTTVIAAWGLAAVLAMYRMLQSCPMRPTPAKHPRADQGIGAVEIRDPCQYLAIRFDRRKVSRPLVTVPYWNTQGTFHTLQHATDWPKCVEVIRDNTSSVPPEVQYTISRCSIQQKTDPIPHPRPIGPPRYFQSTVTPQLIL